MGQERRVVHIQRQGTHVIIVRPVRQGIRRVVAIQEQRQYVVEQVVVVQRRDTQLRMQQEKEEVEV